MPNESAIAWTDKTWNVVVVGCTHVSPGCDRCYAETLHTKWFNAQHDGHYANGKPAPVNYTSPFADVRRMNPLRAGKRAEHRGVYSVTAWKTRLYWPLRLAKPSIIFVNSMTDIFHSVATDDDIREALDVMRAAPWHQFQILTKRAGRLRHLGPLLDWPANVSMGDSIESDDLVGRADALRIGARKAAARFISAEPLISALPSLDLTGIDWLIVGAESGSPGVRPMDLDWVRQLRDKAQESGTRFFLKQIVDPATGRKTQLPALDGRVWNEYPPHFDAWIANPPTVPPMRERERIMSDLYERWYPIGTKADCSGCGGAGHYDFRAETGEQYPAVCSMCDGKGYYIA